MCILPYSKPLTDRIEETIERIPEKEEDDIKHHGEGQREDDGQKPL
jgi:hypothetical protein